MDTKGHSKIEVQTMFDRFAWKYDFLNHLFSLHIDKLWRRRAANELRGMPLDKVLDVATGTADMALTLQKRLKPGHITGVDISEGMLAIGRQKVEKKGLQQHISLEYGDSEALHFDEQTFDAVTVAFGVRNFENLEKGLKEIYRTLKTGGKIVILELAIPQIRFVRGIFNFYFFRIMPFVGRLISKDAHAHKYLPNSVQSFPYGAKFKEIMENCGFSEIKIRSLSLGIVYIYTGKKLID